jgi:hypothetical protein
MPQSEEQNAGKALENFRKKISEKINIGNGSITYPFSKKRCFRKLWRIDNAYHSIC